MKCIMFITLLLGCSAVSPIEKTIQLLSDLQAKVVKDGEAEAKNYEEFGKYCHDESMETEFAIKTGKAAAERASASVAESSARIDGAETKIDELSTTIATAQADLDGATKIREQEAADFNKMDADLAQTVDMLTRAHGIIEREMNKGSFVQTDSPSKITAALQAVLNAATVNSMDKAKVQALMQVDDLDLQPAGAPDPAAYNSQSGGILSTLEDMLEKAKAQRAEGQKAEMNNKFNFDMLKQKLEDAMANGDKNLKETKKAKAQAEEDKAVAEGELATAQGQVKDDTKHLQELGFSVSVFSGLAICCITVLLIRRKFLGGELGGPTRWKYATSGFLVSLWVVYVCISASAVLRRPSKTGCQR